MYVLYCAFLAGVMSTLFGEYQLHDYSWTPTQPIIRVFHAVAILEFVIIYSTANFLWGCQYFDCLSQHIQLSYPSPLVRFINYAALLVTQFWPSADLRTLRHPDGTLIFPIQKAKLYQRVPEIVLKTQELYDMIQFIRVWQCDLLIPSPSCRFGRSHQIYREANEGPEYIYMTGRLSKHLQKMSYIQAWMLLWQGRVRPIITRSMNTCLL